ncbi:hypothetical protein BS17DRAFT_555737 [Gyrodon lividus]|nr:hypothetical protein BS17DRAFT_555737 [Gyrodon lividus]
MQLRQQTQRTSVLGQALLTSWDYCKQKDKEKDKEKEKKKRKRKQLRICTSNALFSRIKRCTARWANHTEF